MSAISRECFASCTPAAIAERANEDCQQPHCQCGCHEVNGVRR